MFNLVFFSVALSCFMHCLQAETTESLLSELAKTIIMEKAALKECGDLLALTALLEVSLSLYLYCNLCLMGHFVYVNNFTFHFYVPLEVTSKTIYTSLVLQTEEQSLRAHLMQLEDKKMPSSGSFTLLK